jgi:hypothetical protein
LQVASFPAGTAIIDAVLTQTDLIQALAEAAILVTGAASLRVIADHAHEFLGHSGRLTRFLSSGNGTMVGDPVAARKSFDIYLYGPIIDPGQQPALDSILQY